MTDHAEEQEMEAEALQAIFDTHFTMLQDNVWQVDIYPELSMDDDNANNHVACQLVATLPTTYPEDLPQLTVSILKGLSDEHKHALQELAVTEARDNLGSPSLFSVSEALREWLVEHNVPGLDDRSMHAIMMRKKLEQEKQQDDQQIQFESQKEETILTEAERTELEIHKRRLEGTPCNKENFEKWHAQFVQEQAAEKEQRQLQQEGADSKSKRSLQKVVDKSGRSTGFQFFSGKLDNLEALEAAAEHAEVDDEEEGELDACLFEEDVDLDDLDFDDEDDDEEEEDLDI